MWFLNHGMTPDSFETLAEFGQVFHELMHKSSNEVFDSFGYLKRLNWKPQSMNE